jgi:hypothetical protein
VVEDRKIARDDFVLKYGSIRNWNWASLIGHDNHRPFQSYSRSKRDISRYRQVIQFLYSRPW